MEYSWKPIIILYFRGENWIRFWVWIMLWIIQSVLKEQFLKILRTSSQGSILTYVIDNNSNSWHILMELNTKIEIESNLKCKIWTKFHLYWK